MVQGLGYHHHFGSKLTALVMLNEWLKSHGLEVQEWRELSR